MELAWQTVAESLMAVVVILVAIFVAVSFWKVFFPPDPTIEELGARIDYLTCNDGSLATSVCAKSTRYARNIFPLVGDKDADQALLLFTQVDSTISVTKNTQIRLQDSGPGARSASASSALLDLNDVGSERIEFNNSEVCTGPCICKLRNAKLTKQNCAPIARDDLVFVTVGSISGRQWVSENLFVLLGDTYAPTFIESPFSNEEDSPYMYAEPFVPLYLSEEDAIETGKRSMFPLYIEYVPPNTVLVAPYVSQLRDQTEQRRRVLAGKQERYETQEVSELLVVDGVTVVNRFGMLPSRQRENTPRKIILHHTVELTAQQTEEILLENSLGVHFILEKDGTLYQYAGVKDSMDHAKGENEQSIGIEIVNSGYEPFTSQQYAVLRAILPVLASQLGPVANPVIGHWETPAAVQTQKWDPHPNFDWSKIGYPRTGEQTYFAQFCGRIKGTVPDATNGLTYSLECYVPAETPG